MRSHLVKHSTDPNLSHLHNEFYPALGDFDEFKSRVVYGRKKTCLRVAFIFISIYLFWPVNVRVCALPIESAFEITADGFEVHQPRMAYRSPESCLTDVILIIKFKHAREINVNT